MPDSMMSAATGFSLNVRGSSIAIAASGPMPGRTPITVPTRTPMKQYVRFSSESATLKPRARLGKSSASASTSAPGEEPVRQLEPVDEQSHRAADQQDDQDDELEHPGIAPGERARDDEGEEGGHEARFLDQQPEGGKRGEQPQQGTPSPRPDARACRPVGAARGERADHDQDDAEPGRKIARTHAHQASHRIRARYVDGKHAEA